MQTPMESYWRKCTTCKKPIGYKAKYWICSVSTCNRVRTDLVFCDLRCFDAHVPVLNHRDAGAFEKISPSQGAVQQVKIKEQNPSQPTEAVDPSEILVIASRVKAYIQSKANMNTSDAVMNVLSDYVRKIADQAIKNADQAIRKTVMDRDIR